jgi:4-hydroxy-2-oxoheptanedioate aldolase
MNLLKARLTHEHGALGTWCLLPSAGTVSAIAAAGVDFVIIDLEHGAISNETVEHMVLAAEAGGCSAVIRTADDSEPTLLMALESGASSILVPHVETPDQALSIARACRYHPDGTRGLAPYTRAHGYTHQDLPRSISKANQDTLVGVLVEGSQGIGRLQEIASTPGLDLIYLGVYDISQSLGMPGQIDHPSVLKMVRQSLGVIHSNGVRAGSFARDLVTMRRLFDDGCDLVAYLADTGALREYYSEIVSAARQYCGGRRDKRQTSTQ